MKRKLIVITATLLALGGLSAGIALAAGAGGDEAPLTGSALERATAAALEYTGGGEVVETETGDDGAAYGVEVRLAEGRVVEVNLDEQFRVMSAESDDDGAGEDEGADPD
jgi:hypothetical protein